MGTDVDAPDGDLRTLCASVDQADYMLGSDPVAVSQVEVHMDIPDIASVHGFSIAPLPASAVSGTFGPDRHQILFLAVVAQKAVEFHGDKVFEQGIAVQIPQLVLDNSEIGSNLLFININCPDTVDSGS